MEPITFEQCQEAANYIREKILTTAKVAVVCGLSALAKNIEDEVVLPYQEIPHFPKPTGSSNGPAQLVYGKLAGNPVIFMEGRFHFYEGYTIQQCIMTIRVLKLLGVETLIITTSAAAVNIDYKVGDFMLITDHINLMGFGGTNPLIGQNDGRWGPRFTKASTAYEKDLVSKSKQLLNETKYEGTIREGVYVVTAGPTYKTNAENHMFVTLGADAVGMSVVPEVLAAKHCGMTVVAMSLIINEVSADGETQKEMNAKEIAAIEEEKCQGLRPFIEKLVLCAGQKKSGPCKCRYSN